MIKLLDILLEIEIRPNVKLIPGKKYIINNLGGYEFIGEKNGMYDIQRGSTLHQFPKEFVEHLIKVGMFKLDKYDLKEIEIKPSIKQPKIGMTIWYRALFLDRWRKVTIGWIDNILPNNKYNKYIRLDYDGPSDHMYLTKDQWDRMLKKDYISSIPK